jgi:hypothetical protein
MSKTKQYYSDNAENQVDQILAHMKSGQIDEDKAKKEILNVDNVNMLDIDEHNIDEVIYYSLNG